MELSEAWSVAKLEGIPGEAIIGGIVLLVAVVIAYAYWRGFSSRVGETIAREGSISRPRDERSARSRASLIREIALLDAQFEKGGIDPEEYHTRREALKMEALRKRQDD